MHESSNDTNEKIIYRELCYKINGLLFEIQNKLGRFCREKQYGDLLEKVLRENFITFIREKTLPNDLLDNQRTNVVDFEIESKILIDLKAKPVVSRDDYIQMQRYLQAGGYKLGLIVNFRSRYLKPIRIIRINSHISIV